MRRMTIPPGSSVDALMRQLAQRALQAEQAARTAREEADAARAEAQAARAELAATQAQGRRIAAKATELEHKVKADEIMMRSMMSRIRTLVEDLANATQRPVQLALSMELDLLQRKIDDLNHELFGRSSERRGRKTDPAGKPKPPKKRQTGHGPKPQPELKTEDQQHLLPPGEDRCRKCGSSEPLKAWEGQTQDTEEVEIVERTFKIVVHKCQVYACTGCGHFETAPAPPRLIPGGRYSPSFGVAVAVDKYQDHLPLERQVKRMAEQGLTVTSQTLWDQIRQVYILLLPTLLVLQQTILAQPRIHIDETPWRLMRTGESKRWWAWVLSDGKRVFIQLAASRGMEAARQALQGYSGILMADRYVVYESLEKEADRNPCQQLELVAQPELGPLAPLPNFLLAACWMHGRRGFVKAVRGGEVEANEALDLIAELYAVEAEAEELAAKAGGGDEALFAARQELRTERSAGIIARLLAWMDEVKVLPGSRTESAISWLRNGWTNLTRFVTNPLIPLDNGEAERRIRGMVLGRKTHAGSRSEEGTRVAAAFYSFVATCAAEGVDVRDWMLEAVGKALVNRRAVYLPEEYAADLRAKAAAEADSAGAADTDTDTDE